MLFLGFLLLGSRAAKAFFEGRCKKAINQASLNRADLGALRLPLPPIVEQRKIAAILSSADEAIEATQAVIDQLQVVKKAMMAELLTRGLPGRHSRFKQSEIGELPADWHVVDLQDVIVDGPTNGLYKPANKIGRGALVAGMTAIDGTTLNWSSVSRAELDEGDISRFGLRSGDLLVTRVYATVEGVGRFIVVPEPSEPVGYESNMMRLRLNGAKAAPDFVSAHMSLRMFDERSSSGRLWVHRPASTMKAFGSCRFVSRHCLSR